MSFRRVVITGMGSVTPLGTGVEMLRKGLRQGLAGAGPITRFSTEGFQSKNACEVKNFTPLHGTHLLDPFIQYALASAAEAIHQSGFNFESVDPYRVGIAVGSSKGGMHSLNSFRERFERNPSAILAARVYANLVPNFACQWIARKWKIHGPAKCYVTACATGTTSIIEGARMIEDGTVDYVLAGASDASLVPFLVAGYEQLGVLAREGIYPFDSRRDGFLLGEGAGVVLLETLESAKARHAKIFAEMIGYAYGTDCFNPVRFNPEGDALTRALKKLLENSRLLPDEIGYVNLHGTGTREGDVYETDQIKKAFEKKAYSIPMSSTKSMLGHMLGASGAVETIACCLAIQEGFIPPTINLEKPEPECDLDYTPKRAKDKKVNVAVSLSMGFGGHIAAIALRKI